MKHASTLATLLALAACGGAQTPQGPRPDDTARTARNDPPARQGGGDEAAGGIVIEGQLGFLSQQQLQGVLGPATPQLAACYNDRLAERPYVSGRIELKIRIGADGAPVWAIPLNSTLGDRAIEQCMVERVMALRFPRPRGGETETTYPLELEGGDDARPATPWTPDRISRVVDQHRPALRQCTQGATGSFAVTLYAAPRGTVAAAGVSVPNRDGVAAADCLVREVTSWRVPDPGSWYARATIQVN